jgi:hypothetical protein
MYTPCKFIVLNSFLGYAKVIRKYYADDIVLLAPAITSLQMLLNVCENELGFLQMKIDTEKKQCVYGLELYLMPNVNL